MPNPPANRGLAGDPALGAVLPPILDPGEDSECCVLFRGVSWDDYDAMLRIRDGAGRRFKITYDRGLMEVRFPTRREVFSHVTWDDYTAMLQIAGDGPVRVTYDHGEMEVVMPSLRHEALTRLFQTLMTDLLRALRVPYKSGGSATLRRQGLVRGLEPDLCLYFRELDRLRGQPTPAPEDVPPPDLAIEVEVTRRALEKLSFYADLGVPEVWRFDGQAVRVYVLQPDRTYAEAEASAVLPQARPRRSLPEARRRREPAGLWSCWSPAAVQMPDHRLTRPDAAPASPR